VKKVIILSFLIIFSVSAFAAKLDINIIYEASRMKVTETICGVTPDLEQGFIETEEGCFSTGYEVDTPMYGFVFEPKTISGVDETRCAYYISFFDAAFPKADLVKTEIVNDGKVVREIKNLVHERTFQGIALLKNGENLRLSSNKEPKYTIVYIIGALIVAIGVFFILRKK